MGQLARRWTSVVLSTLIVAGCGGGGSTSPNSPSPNSGGNTGQTCSSVGPLGAAKGTVTATVNSTAFNGGVSPGNSVYTPIPAGPFLPTPHDLITIGAVCGDGSQIIIAARAGSWINGQFVLGAAGTTQIGVGANGNAFTDPQTQQPLNHIVATRVSALLRRVPSASVADRKGRGSGSAACRGLRTPRADVLQHARFRFG
jgi:hypothetical protein